MIYTFDSRVRFSEVGEDEILTIHSLINYLQDCSTFQSEDLNVGMEVLHEKKMAWMTIAWQIVIDRLPKFGEKITIGTQAIGTDGILARRNFFLKDDEGNMIVRANSYWTMVDISNGRALRITPDMIDVYGREEPLEMENAPRKIRLPKEEAQKLPGFPVEENLLDYNHHVNNAQYVNLAFRAAETLAGDKRSEELPALLQIRAEYRKAAVLGDIMVPEVICQGELVAVSLKNPEGETYAVVEFRFASDPLKESDGN